MRQASEQCPFEFKFDATQFTLEYSVFYRIPERFGDMPVMDTLLAVFDDYVEISANDASDPDRRKRGTRERRPAVTAA